MVVYCLQMLLYLLTLHTDKQTFELYSYIPSNLNYKASKPKMCFPTKHFRVKTLNW